MLADPGSCVLKHLGVILESSEGRWRQGPEATEDRSSSRYDHGKIQRRHDPNRGTEVLNESDQGAHRESDHPPTRPTRMALRTNIVSTVVPVPPTATTVAISSILSLAFM